MSTLTRFYPGDRGLELALVVTLVVVLVSSAAWLLSRRLTGRAALRHLVLMSALICCLAAPAAAGVCAATGLKLVSIPIVRGEVGRAAADDVLVAPVGGALVETDPVRIPPQPSTAPPLGGTEAPSVHASSAPGQSGDNSVATAVNESPAASVPPAPESPPASNPTLAPGSFRGIATGAMLIWAAGTLLMLVRLTRNGLGVVRLRRSSRLLQDETYLSPLRKVAAEFGMRRPLLLVSGRAVAPLAVGFGRPAVVLPEHLLGAIGDAELRDVFRHEAAHLRRGDQWVVLLQELAGALYWPVVPVHALNRELQQAREDLCDNVVLLGSDAIGYGKTLLHVAELLVKAHTPRAAVGMFRGPGELEQRITGLIDPKRSLMTTTGRTTSYLVWFLVLAVGVLLSATRFAASAPPEVPAPPKPPAQKHQPTGDPDDPKFAGHFNGRVTDPDGKPLSGAKVYMVRFQGVPNASGPVRATTDADGRFEFDAPDLTYTRLDGLPARREGIIIVTKDGFAPDWFHTWGADHGGLVEYWDPVKGAEVSLQLAKDDVPIRGRFLDPAGRPLVGARVRLTGLMVPRERDLGAHLDRWSNASISSGFLTKVPDFQRELYHPQLLPGLATETRTDADGRFTLSGLGRDRLATLSVSAPSVVDTALEVMTRDAPDTRILFKDGGENAGTMIHGARFTLKLKPGRTIKGRVIDRDSRKPIAGMWVGPMQNPIAGVSSSLYPGATDADGRFTITGLDPSWDKHVIMAVAAPGLPYQTAGVEAKGEAEVVIECPRGIPFRLKVTDEQGKPVEAEVTHYSVQPNPQVASFVPDQFKRYWPDTPAARRADGTYEGFVVPGPGAVLIQTPRAAGYRAAYVNPKAFFAPGRTDWTSHEDDYGTRNTVTAQTGGSIDQRDYAAIVLVNPPKGSGPLELTARVVKDQPRRVSLVDPDGKPVVGAEMSIDYWHGWSSPLRAASFPLTRLHPDRVLHITFRKEARQLVGYLAARGDGDAHHTVRMQPWGTVTGRLVDETGRPLSDAAIVINAEGVESTGDKTNAKGQFHAERIVPGLNYRAEVYRGSERIGTAILKLTLRPGEVRDLGDIRVTPPAKADSGRNRTIDEALSLRP